MHKTYNKNKNKDKSKNKKKNNKNKNNKKNNINKNNKNDTYGMSLQGWLVLPLAGQRRDELAPPAGLSGQGFI